MSLVLREASPVQIRRAAINSYAAWGAPHLSLEQYLAREALSAAAPFASLRVSVVLLRADQSPDDLDFLCACELYPRECLYSSSKSPNLEGPKTVVTATCVSVASVFTPEHHRKNGYAAAMMKLVRERIESIPSAVASTLYSEVGDYYGKFGWRRHRSECAYLDPHSKTLMEWTMLSAASGIPVQTIVVTAEGGKSIEPSTIPIAVKAVVERILSFERDLLVNEMKNRSETCFAILPTLDTLAWFWSADDFYAVTFNRPLASRKGCHISERAYAFWTHNWVENSLILLIMRFDTTAEACGLLGCALEEARDCSLKKVVLWDPSANDPLVDLLKSVGIAVVERESTHSLSCLAFWGEDAADENCVWVRNEKYAWV
ncbi:hypothetical protein HDU83_004834 [Entophlyctis luteolus]|nr:hypothetical protein HDU83_004834 [Entophlyctis luteolus]